MEAGGGSRSPAAPVPAPITPPTVPSFSSSSALVELQLLSTNDTHSKMLPDEPKGPGGLVRRARALAALRKEAPDSTLVFDVGDHFTGSPFFTFLAGEASPPVRVRSFVRSFLITTHNARMATNLNGPRRIFPCFLLLTM